MTTTYMTPAAKPVVEGLDQREIVFAKEQPEYNPLRALVSPPPDSGRVLTRWSPTDSQRLAIAAGADIFLELSTFGAPLQPIRMAVSDDSLYLARELGIVQPFQGWQTGSGLGLGHTAQEQAKGYEPRDQKSGSRCQLRAQRSRKRWRSPSTSPASCSPATAACSR